MDSVGAPLTAFCEEKGIWLLVDGDSSPGSRYQSPVVSESLLGKGLQITKHGKQLWPPLPGTPGSAQRCPESLGEPLPTPASHQCPVLSGCKILLLFAAAIAQGWGYSLRKDRIGIWWDPLLG